MTASRLGNIAILACFRLVKTTRAEIFPLDSSRFRTTLCTLAHSRDLHVVLLWKEPY